MRKLSVRIMFWMLVALSGWAGSVGAVELTALSSGNGTVANSPSGTVPCATPTTGCSSYALNTSVTITATPDAGYGVLSWTGGGCSVPALTCNIVLNSGDVSVTASFAPLASLTASPNPNGWGTVSQSANPVGDACSPADTNCKSYATGRTIPLIANTNSGYTFSGWTGCTSSTSVCNYLLNANASVTANFNANLVINHVGGTVAVDSSGIACSPAVTGCVGSYPKNTTVKLTATANSSNTFSGWTSSASCQETPAIQIQTGTCTLSIVEATNVTANFNIGTTTGELTLTTNGTVSNPGGKITASPTGAACASPPAANTNTTCYSYTPGTTVTLTASPNSGVEFLGFTGVACAESLANQIAQLKCTVNNPTGTATANFRTKLTVEINGTDNINGRVDGTLNAAPIITNCTVNNSAVCSPASPSFAPGDVVTLTANPQNGSIFKGWTGGDCSGTGPCNVTMSSFKRVTANFGQALAVTLTGSGVGNVTSPVGPINCGINGNGVCGTNTTTTNPTVLTASASANSIFSGWSGNVPNSCLTTVNTSVNSGSTSYSVTQAITILGEPWIQTDIYVPGTITTMLSPVNCKITNFPAGQQTNVVATFSTNSTTAKKVTVYNEGSGSDYGRVTSTPSGITCEGFKFQGTPNLDCAQSFEPGTGIDFFADVNQIDGAFFAGWIVEYSKDSGQTWVTLNATSNTQCLGVEPTCHVTMPSSTVYTDVRVRATYSLQYILNLTVQNNGTGTTVASGNITANSSNLQTVCTDSCTETYDANRVVTLTATPTKNSIFKYWVGEACTTGINSALNPVCTITMNQSHSVTAVFDPTNPSRYDLYVFKEGSGSNDGVVKSPADGSVINCGKGTNTLCQGNFAAGQGITLYATEDTTVGTYFSRWQVYYLDTTQDPPKWVLQPNMCLGQEQTCHITMASSFQVRAQFDVGFILTVVRDGTGKGSVVSNVPALDACAVYSSSNLVCTQSFSSIKRIYTDAEKLQNPALKDDPVVLTAVADTTSVFSGWTGIDPETGLPICHDAQNETAIPKTVCKVSMDKAHLVTATFFQQTKENTELLAVSTKGSGKVVSSPSGIDCGSTCLKSFPTNTSVTLQAQPDAGSHFVGWSGGGCSGSSICTIVMNTGNPVSVQAMFESTLSLTVNNFGTGQGTVTSSNVSGISCGTNCSADFSAGTGVRLVATPAANSRFKGWTGACSASESQPICNLTISGSALTVGAQFEVIDGPLLTITKSGSGTGTITSSSGDINCGSFCSQTFATNLVVRLTAKPDTNASFGAWGGACANRLNLLTCDVTMDQAKNVTATFNVKTNTLTVTKDGAGTGTVTSTPAGISCGADCTEDFLNGVVVGLSVVPDPNSVFSGWAGSCAGQSGTCYVTMNNAQSATATFALANQLTVSMQGDGFGTVISQPTGISCEGTCSATFLKDTAITLTANVLGGSQFTGWTGACTGNQAKCFVKMKDGMAVTAWFKFIANPANGSLRLGKLNDTGIDWCANNGSAYIANKEGMCTTLMTTHPYQDGQEGRDMYARQGALTKLGKGEAGFDYTRICNNGQVAGEGGCPALPTLGDADLNWGCTRDNVTNLIWEVKTVGGLRDKDATYTWFEPNDSINGGSKGDDCSGVSCKNTKLYIDAVNTLGLCGSNDWRLPTRQELHSIVNQGRGRPAVDITYFPNTASGAYWTGTPVAAQIFNTWYVNFEYGWDYWANKTSQQHARLVRFCQTCEDNSPVSNPSFQNGRLKLPQVGMDGQYYSADLTMISSQPLAFVLNSAQPISKRIGRNANQVVYYSSTGLAVIGGVEVGNNQYNATLQYVPGSNPPRFVLQSARNAR